MEQTKVETKKFSVRKSFLKWSIVCALGLVGSHFLFPASQIITSSMYPYQVAMIRYLVVLPYSLAVWIPSIPCMVFVDYLCNKTWFGIV